MIIRSTLFLVLLLAALPSSAQTACEETEPFYHAIVEFCVVPEFPTEDDEIFARFVFAIPRSAFGDGDNFEFEVDGNVIRLAGPFSPLGPLPPFEPYEFLFSLGQLPAGDYTLEYYVDLELAMISGGGVVPPSAVRTFTVAPVPQNVPTLQWWGMLLLIGGLLLIATRRMNSPGNPSR